MTSFDVQPRATEAFETLPGRLNAGVLFLCDHASNAIPAGFGNLGLSARDLLRHIAYDIGAASLTHALATHFDAPAVLTRFSRLLIDANRGADDPTLVMQISDGAIIPGNARVTQTEIERRRALYWTPYRDEVSRLIEEMIAEGPVPALISLHSFTPVWNGIARPWEAGVLWDCDPRLAAPIIEALKSENIRVGDNEPYDGALAGDTLDEHGNGRGLPHVLIEIRQDLIAEAGGAALWGDRLACVLGPVLAHPDLHIVRKYSSRNRVRHGRVPP